MAKGYRRHKRPLKPKHFGEVRQIPHNEVWHSFNLQRGMYYGEDEQGYWVSWGSGPQNADGTLAGIKMWRKPKPACGTDDVNLWTVCIEDVRESETARKVRTKLNTSSRKDQYEPLPHMTEKRLKKAFPVSTPLELEAGVIKTIENRRLDYHAEHMFDYLYEFVPNPARWLERFAWNGESVIFVGDVATVKRDGKLVPVSELETTVNG